jgi:hypothetical protein
MKIWGMCVLTAGNDEQRWLLIVGEWEVSWYNALMPIAEHCRRQMPQTADY